MNFLFRVYRWLNILSVDVAAGAVASTIFFAHVAAIPVRPAGMTCLGLVVWMIYTTDHLMDALRLPSPALSARHRYHQHYFWILLIAVLVVMLLVGILLFFIRPEVFKWGSLLLVLVVIYLIINQYLHYLKELAVAVVYVIGVLLPTIARMTNPMDLLLRPEVFGFFILAILNLLIFSWFEIESDHHEGQPSFAVRLGSTNTKRIITVLFGLLTLVQVITLTLNPVNGLVLLVMESALAFIFLFPRYFKVADRYRLMGDGIFLLPILVVLK